MSSQVKGSITPIIFLTGPTASGKTGRAVDIAEPVRSLWLLRFVRPVSVLLLYRFLPSAKKMVFLGKCRIF